MGQLLTYLSDRQGTIKDYGIHGLKSKDIIDKINQCSPKIDTRKNFKDALEKRLEEDEKQAKDRESKRREDGKLAQETRQNLQDQQDKLCLKQLKKERKSNEENERKVKEQIAKDRAIQIAERKAEKQHTEEGKKHVQQSPSKRYYDHSNLNIKQIDGSSLRHSFSSSNTLANVTEWIDNVRTDGDMPYKLFAQFPNRNFEIGDEQKTLQELKLCPSGTLIMKPIKNASTAYAGAPSSISSKGWMNYLYSASDKIYNSVSQAGASVVNYLVTPTAAPEHGRRLGGSSSSSSNATASSPSLNLDRSTSNHHNRNTNYSSSKKTDGDTSKNRQTYNGNSVNYE
ncbi:hypothetical protein [Parasitella parasitica]|uniref:UBX domain-containing protein n=1 Tax=Parasitella parasitica TaxID=35722 RepID=A0A0B7NV78_9FUNG|nr:hypothetical protein [Parasitella parasitica]